MNPRNQQFKSDLCNPRIAIYLYKNLVDEKNSDYWWRKLRNCNS